MNFVNSYQTKEERQEKYKLLIEKGATVMMARRCRDWTMGHIESKIIPYLLENAT